MCQQVNHLAVMGLICSTIVRDVQHMERSMASRRIFRLVWNNGAEWMHLMREMFGVQIGTLTWGAPALGLGCQLLGALWKDMTFVKKKGGMVALFRADVTVRRLGTTFGQAVDFCLFRSLSVNLSRRRKTCVELIWLMVKLMIVRSGRPAQM